MAILADAHTIIEIKWGTHQRMTSSTLSLGHIVALVCMLTKLDACMETKSGYLAYLRYRGALGLGAPWH